MRMVTCFARPQYSNVGHQITQSYIAPISVSLTPSRYRCGLINVDLFISVKYTFGPVQFCSDNTSYSGVICSVYFFFLPFTSIVALTLSTRYDCMSLYLAVLLMTCAFSPCVGVDIQTLNHQRQPRFGYDSPCQLSSHTRARSLYDM